MMVDLVDLTSPAVYVQGKPGEQERPCKGRLNVLDVELFSSRIRADGGGSVHPVFSRSGEGRPTPPLFPPCQGDPSDFFFYVRLIFFTDNLVLLTYHDDHHRLQFNR
jgi:hypothetical protein